MTFSGGAGLLAACATIALLGAAPMVEQVGAIVAWMRAHGAQGTN
jgi:hypothetical protein